MVATLERDYQNRVEVPSVRASVLAEVINNGGIVRVIKKNGGRMIDFIPAFSEEFININNQYPEHMRTIVENASTSLIAKFVDRSFDSSTEIFVLFGFRSVDDPVNQEKSDNFKALAGILRATIVISESKKKRRSSWIETNQVTALDEWTRLRELHENNFTPIKSAEGVSNQQSSTSTTASLETKTFKIEENRVERQMTLGDIFLEKRSLLTRILMGKNGFSEHEADEIVSIIFLKACRALLNGNYHEDSKFMGWLMKIKETTVIDYVRLLHSGIKDYLVPLEDEERLVASHDDVSLATGAVLDLVIQTITRLTVDQQEVMRLYLGGYETDEIASILNIRNGTVRGLKHRAIQRLREILGTDLNQYLHLIS